MTLQTLFQMLNKTTTLQAVRVTGADFNGSTWDGSPLEPAFEGQTNFEWVQAAADAKKILIEARGHTDYAWFGVKDEYNNVTWAGPGDYIVRLDSGELLVVSGTLVRELVLAPSVPLKRAEPTSLGGRDLTRELYRRVPVVDQGKGNDPIWL